METEIVFFVKATTIIPENWNDWFWSTLSDSSSLTFGDNDYSLVNAERFLQELNDILDNEDDISENDVATVKSKLSELIEEDIYISL
jgi:hypothetical protein